MEQILNKSVVSKVFPNGFTSWCETHTEICMEIGRRMEREDFGDGATSLEVTESEMGTVGIWRLAEYLTDEFERTHDASCEMENYLETLETFMIEKL